MPTTTERTTDPAPGDATTGPEYHFPGHTSFVKASAVRAGVPAHLAAKIAGSVPIGQAGRILAGLSETARRARGRPFRDDELSLVRTTLLAIDEVRWAYRLGADAADAMIAEAAAAFGLDEIAEADGPPPAEWRNVDALLHLQAVAGRLGLPGFVADSARNFPELAWVSACLGRALETYRRKETRRGVAVLAPVELPAVRAIIGCARSEAAVFLRVLADATEGMFREAYTSFGLDLPSTPPPGMPPSRCLASHLQAKRRGVRPVAVWA